MQGTVLGNRYELLEKVGEGGMAVVYKARCRLLNRFVAVKILKEEYSKDKDFVEKFKREATAAASLSDNNIVNIYDVGSQGDINYIVLEYVDGKTLKQIIREQGRLNYKTAVGISIQIAKALDCAHRHNIIHRDIKPHNILVTEEGLIKVTDFGIAKASSSVTITNSNRVVGSAHYFSPEQAKGSYVDCRTDIYSLGIVMYEMATGKVPYDADSPVSVALKHIQEPVVPPNKLSKSIPDSLNKLILKAIEKEPIRRYQNIREMLADLKKIQNNQEINIVSEDFDDESTRIMSPVHADDRNDYDEEPKKGSKKRKALFVSIAVFLILLIGGISFYFASRRLGNSSGSIVGADVEVPSIIGLNKDDAQKLVEDKGLKFTITRYDKSDKSSGTVLECYPDVGTKVKAQSEVRVIVSSGSESGTIPDLTGIDIGQAKDIINNSGFTVGKIDYSFSDNVPQNAVISQNPAPDSSSGSNNVISLVVSKGPEVKVTQVPDLKDQNIDQAEAMLANAKLVLGTKTEVLTTDKSKDGIIFSQSVDANSKVKEGTEVSVSYYKYQEGSADGNEAMGGNSRLVASLW